MYMLSDLLLLVYIHLNFIYYSFIISLDQCNGSCNILDDSSGGICLPNKTEDVNLNVIKYDNKNK